MTFEYIFDTYVEPLVPLVAAALVYLFGRRAYFRQKEYELVTTRYLGEGIDAISKNVDRSLALFRHNWWQSTIVLISFKKVKKLKERSEVQDSIKVLKEHFSDTLESAEEFRE